MIVGGRPAMGKKARAVSLIRNPVLEQGEKGEVVFWGGKTKFY